MGVCSIWRSTDTRFSEWSRRSGASSSLAGRFSTSSSSSPGVYLVSLEYLLLPYLMVVVVAAPVGSPTEIIQDDDDEDLESPKEENDASAQGDVGGSSRGREQAMSVDATGGSPGRGKRTREAVPSSDGRSRRHGGPRASDERAAPERDETNAPVTSAEIKRLLELHLGPLTASWTEMTGRVQNLEESRAAEQLDREALHGRLARVEQKEATVEAQVAQLSKEVDELKRKKGVSAAPVPAAATGDAWAEYRAKHGPAPGMPTPGGPPVPRDHVPHAGGTNDDLTEDDKPKGSKVCAETALEIQI